MTARDRALRAIEARLENTNKAEEFRRAIQQPTLYNGSGRVKTLGAAGGVPIRGQLATGGLSIGEVVAIAQGVLRSDPDAVTRRDFDEGLRFALD
ncbi:MAG: hypothetical protein F6K11_34555, partial [Leptolyngbya sp. SIO3F4]|nr:hypothetical protein [Leptolyngbya sp. SIO3F4]